MARVSCCEENLGHIEVPPDMMPVLIASGTGSEMSYRYVDRGRSCMVLARGGVWVAKHPRWPTQGA